MVAAFFSTFSGLHCPTSRFLQIPLELLVMQQFSKVTGFQLHGFLHRSLSQLSTTQILQLLLLDLDICRQINASSMCLWVLPLLLGKFMPLSNTASWISVLRTIAYLDQLSASEDVFILFRCHLANALQNSFIKVYLIEIWSLHRWLVALSYTVCCRVSNVTKALISVNANP